MPDDSKRALCLKNTSFGLLTHPQHRDIGKRKTIVIVAEGALDSKLQPIHAEQVKVILSERLGLDTRVTTLGHTQRGGRPCAMDRILVRHSQLLDPSNADV